MSTQELAVVPIENSKMIRLGTMAATGPSGVVEVASEIATQLAKIINDRKLYTSIRGKKFVQVEGWTTLGAMLGILPVEDKVAKLEDGSYEASVNLIRASDGAIVGRGSAILGMDESTWADRAEYARRSMAITRATGKAFRLGFSWIMTLAGYEVTPAEEMPTDPEPVHREGHEHSTTNCYHCKQSGCVDGLIAVLSGGHIYLRKVEKREPLTHGFAHKSETYCPACKLKWGSLSDAERNEAAGFTSSPSKPPESADSSTEDGKGAALSSDSAAPLFQNTKPEKHERLITIGQVKRFYAIAHARGWKDHELLDLLKKYSLEKASDISVGAYKEICNTLEAGSPTAMDQERESFRQAEGDIPF